MVRCVYPTLGYNGRMENPEAYGPSETIGEWDYFRGKNGDLYRAHAGLPTETRLMNSVVPKPGAEFALRLARIGAGLPEHGK
jgi:hypothetical protein